MIVGTEMIGMSKMVELDEEWKSKAEALKEVPKNVTVPCKVKVGEFPIKVWYSLKDCFYGTWGTTNTVLRVDRAGLSMVVGEGDSIHANDPFNPECGGMKPLDWHVAKDFKAGKVVFSLPNKKSSNKMKTSVPHVVFNDGQEMIVHEKNISSWLDNYRKLFVEQPFRLTAEVVEQFEKDSESMSDSDSDKLWKAICKEAK
jgi:hypothetical protein